MKSTRIKTLLHTLLVFISLLSLNTQAGVEITFIHNDALGTPVAGTDEQGNVKWRAHYQPYGDEVLGERQLFGVRTGYTGHRDDPETGLTYMGARYYSPVLGRFMGVDSAGVDASDIHSFNRYAYANNNPYRFIDPDGRVVETAIDIVSLGLSINLFKQNPSLVNGLGVAFDGLATVVPFLPGGFGIIKSLGNVADAAGDAKGAGNIATAPNLAADLRLQSARSPFKADGSLTDDAIRNSTEIVPASRIGDPSIPPGFSKFSTETFQSPSGSFQTRFLKNTETGEVLLDKNFKTIFNSTSGQK